MNPKFDALWVVYDEGDGHYWQTLLRQDEAEELAHEINTSGRYRFTGKAAVARFTPSPSSRDGNEET